MAGLSKLMNGVDETTIRSGLDLLQAADLIQVIRHGRWFEVKVEPLTEKSIAMFASSETNNHPEAPEPIGFSDPVHETLLALCRQHKIPSGLAAEITRLYSQLPHSALPDFQDMLNRAEHDHVNNRVRGRYNVPHCGFLLRHVLRDIIATTGQARPVSASVPMTIEEINQREADAVQRRDEIQANPLHAEFVIDDFAIRDRVQICFREIGQIEDQVHRHITRHAESQTTNHQDVIRLSGNLYQAVMARALAQANGYYNKEKKATLDEFEQAINVALQERGIDPMTFHLETQAPPPAACPKKTSAKVAITTEADKRAADWVCG